MGKFLRFLFPLVLLALPTAQTCAADARFDLVGPRIDVRVTRGADTLPIASVPNLQAGDKLWIHPDLPPTQSVHYLLVCVFLRGTTNPPPNDWFIRVETWNRKVQQEGVFVTVPVGAEQAVLLMAPETGGDFSTLRSAVTGRPGIFVRASQDLAEAGFEQARIEKYLASIRQVPPSDARALQEHSALLARTLALKPNEDCFKRPVDTQFTCLTQTGTQTLLDDGHGQSIASSLSNGANSDFINAASATRLGGGGLYSAYVGAVIDLVRIMGNLHTAQYQYIPAIGFPQGESLNLRLNTPPSFHNPKSVLVIGLPAVQAAASPPLRPADAGHVACLLQPNVVLPIEGAPLVFSTALAHDLRLHLNIPAGAPAEPDIALLPDAFQGGLLLQQTGSQRTPLLPARPVPVDLATARSPVAVPAAVPEKPQPEPILLTGVIQGRWGFDSFTGPAVSLQQLPGTGWHVITAEGEAGASAGHEAKLLLASTGSACVHTIVARPEAAKTDLAVPFHQTGKPENDSRLELILPSSSDLKPGDMHLAIQQYGQPKADELSARTYAEPAQIASVELHAGDRTLLLTGLRLGMVEGVALGDLYFRPAAQAAEEQLTGRAAATPTTLRLSLQDGAPAPPTHADEKLVATATLRDGRTLTVPVVVAAPRPMVTLLRKTVDRAANAVIVLTDPEDLPLDGHLSFTLKTPATFPRTGQVEVETLDGTLRTVLTLAPSGGLMLQDPHTVVASLDPLRSFGPSAFGPLHVRAVFPAAAKPQAAETAVILSSEPPASDWLPLATLVRLPQFTQLACTPEPGGPQCIVTGTNLFLLDSLSADPAFASPVSVPDGYTGTTLAVPPTAAGTLFLRLRDDPKAIDVATLPSPAASGPASARKKSAGVQPQPTIN